jgi:hypothetical protein
MNTIDWSKAPEGAEIHFQNQTGTAECFAMFRGSEVYYAYPGMTQWTRWAGESKDAILSRFRHSLRVWIGKDLPPVGTVCEYDARPVGKGDPLWVTVKINYLSEWTIVFQCIAVPEGAKQENIGVELAEMADASTARRFRQTRTPEQIAAEEREKAIDEMAEVARAHTGFGVNLADMQALYDSGYRRKVTP